MVDSASTYDLGGEDLMVRSITTGVTAPGAGQPTVGTTVAAGSALTLTANANAGRTIALNALAGSTVTLPAATGTNNTYRFVVTVLATSNSHIVKVANAADFFVGILNGARTDTANTVLGFAAANSGTVSTNSDTITLNRTTTGSVNVGEEFTVQDIASNTWLVRGTLSATGALFATPFSATV